MDNQTRAEILDLLYTYATGKDYVQEAFEIATLVKQRHPRATDFLGVACGSGLHLIALRDHFGLVEGTETFEPMCRKARQRATPIVIHLAEAKTLALPRTFDAIAVLFSTIARAITLEELTDTVGNLTQHLSPGGVLIVDPWYTPDDWNVKPLEHIVAVTDDALVIRASHIVRQGNVSTSHMTYILGKATPGIQVHQESRDLTLFSYDEYRTAFERADLTEVQVVRLPPRRRPRIVGVAKSPASARTASLFMR